MFFREVNEIDLGETPIDNIFIDIFMPMSNGTYVKIYLLGYRYSLDASINENITNKAVAKNLNIPLIDVLAAWDFWEDKGIIKKHKKDTDEDWNYSVEFLNLKKLYLENILSTNNGSSSRVTPDNLIAYNQNPSIQKMFNGINEIINRPLMPNEKMQLLELMDRYNMSMDMIKSAYAYSKEKRGIKSIKYVEGIIRNWYDAKIYTLEDLEEYFAKKSERFSLYRRVYKELGISVDPSKEARKVMDSWIDTFEFPLEIILKACSKSINTSNPSIKYIDGILKSWHEKGFKTIEDVEKEEIERSKIYVVEKNKAKAPTPIKTKFHNFEERFSKYSPEEFERIALENQKKKFK